MRVYATERNRKIYQGARRRDLEGKYEALKNLLGKEPDLSVAVLLERGFTQSVISKVRDELGLVSGKGPKKRTKPNNIFIGSEAKL